MIFIWRVISIYVHNQQSSKVDRMFSFPVVSQQLGKLSDQGLRVSQNQDTSPGFYQCPPVSAPPLKMNKRKFTLE